MSCGVRIRGVVLAYPCSVALSRPKTVSQGGIIGFLVFFRFERNSEYTHREVPAPFRTRYVYNI